MSTVKISQLPVFSIINANTANTLFVGVDVPTDTTFQMTATTLAQGLYSNNILNVGVNPVVFTNTIAQFSGSDPAYLQINMQNFSNTGTGDVIVTNDSNTAYIDLGITGTNYNNTNSSAYNANDAYIFTNSGVANTGNLFVSTGTTGTKVIFAIGGSNSNNIVAYINANGLVLNTQSYIIFADGSKQFTAGASNAYAQAAYSQANAISSYANTQIAYITGINTYQNTIDSIQTANIAAAFNTANSATSNTIYTQGVDLTQNASIAAVNTYSISAYAQANSISSYANSSISYITGVELTQNTNIAAINTYSMSAYSTANSAQANTIYMQGVNITQNTNIAAINTYSISAYSTANSVQSNTIYTQGVDTTQNTNISLLQGAMASANANIVTLFANASANVTYQSGLNATQNTTIQSAYNQANLANSIANTAVQNTANIILPGNVTFNGANTSFNSNVLIYNAMTVTSNAIFNNNVAFNNYVSIANNLTVNNVFTINASSQLLTMNGIVTIQSSTFPANSAGLRLDGSNNGVAQATTSTGTMLQVVGLDGGYATRILLDNYSYGNSGAYPLFAGRAARGNSSNPAPVQTNDLMFRVVGNGYGNTYTLLGGGSFDVVALENFTDATKGSQINLTTTPVGTNTRYTTVAVNTSVVTVNTNLTVANTIQYNALINNATVTQLTNKSTAVYANGRTGQITTSNALLNKGAAVQFTVYNNYIVSNKDVVIINIASGASVGYNVGINSVSPGSFIVNVHNADGTPSGSNQSDALVLNFAVLRVA